MAFSHVNMAMDGLYPGKTTHRSVANLGHFEIEVIIEPVQPQSYGGGGYVPNTKPDYRVRIRVTRNGKSWSIDKIVSPFKARVIAKLVGIQLSKQEPINIIVTHSSVLEKPEPTITVEKK